MREAAALPRAEGFEVGTGRRWKPYPAYRDSGVEWLGEVPQEWEVHALKYGYSVCLGKMLQSEPSSARDMYVPYLRAANVLWEGVDISDVKEMWFSPEEKASYRLAPGDLVVCEGGETGRCALWEGELPECYIQNAVQRVSARAGYSSRFLYYWLHALKHNGYIDVLCNRATIAHLTAVKLGNLPVLHPPDIDCDAILSFLDRETAELDALIAKKERLIELLQEKRTALITRAVTRGLDPTAPMKNSGVEWLGEIPAHWEVKRAGLLFRERDETGFPDLPLLNVSLNTGVSVREFATDRIERTADDPATYKRVRAGDISFNKMRMWQGAVGVAPVDGLVSPDYTVASPRGGADASYYVELFRTAMCKTEIDKYSHGIVPDRNRLYWDGFKRLSLLFPPPTEQKMIVARFREAAAQLDALASKVSEGIEHLREYRTALISAAVTGKMDVRGEATL